MHKPVESNIDEVGHKPPSFKDFLFGNVRNWHMLWFAVIAVIIQFVLFKYLYPFANYIHGDSFGYIRAAATNADINIHPIGYSRFLRLFSVFSTSDTVLVAFQYLLAQGSGLLLLFTIFYFHRISVVVQWVLMTFMVINPLFLYLSNLISSDCLFMSISLCWLALLIWLMHRPSNKLIAWHGIALALAFMIRYNALVYPAIAIIVLLLSKLPWYKKAIGMALPLLLCGLFIVYTGNKYKVLTGVWQFSPFGGWQAANNAMYTYRYVDSADRKPVPERFRALDNMIRTYFDTSRNLRRHPAETIKASTVYMWTKTMPLMQYRKKVLGKDTLRFSELKQWATVAPLFKDYGTYILKQYPGQYIQHFLWPNTIKYYAPPAEFLEFYNDRKDSVSPIAQSWFKYKSNKVTSRIKDPKAYVLEVYPILTGTMNVVLLACLICFYVLYGIRVNTPLVRTLVPVVAIWILNAVFTIVSSPAAIRLQAFALILETTFAIVLLDLLWKLAKSQEVEKSKKELINQQMSREGALVPE